MPTILAASGQGPKQLGELALAFGLSTLIGLEREWRQKSAGLRTHTLVGVGAALFILVSKYGFGDVLVGDRTVLDPSRIAAQVVSGIGFIGGGLIFVRGDIVRGLTTAAIVWVTAAVGMACGAGLALLAIATTAGTSRSSSSTPRSRRGCPPRARTTSRSASSTRTAAASCATSWGRARVAASPSSRSRRSSSSPALSAACRRWR